MANDEEKPRNLMRRLFGRNKNTSHDDAIRPQDENPLGGGIVASRRGLMQGTLKGAAIVAVDPALAARAAAGAAASLAAPAISAAGASVVRPQYSESAVFLGHRIDDLLNVAEALIPDTEGGYISDAGARGLKESLHSGFPLINEAFDPGVIHRLDVLIEEINYLRLDKANMGTLKLSEITDAEIKTALHLGEISQDDYRFEDPAATIRHIINTFRSITDTKEDITFYDLIKKLEDKAIQVITNIVEHPELMPADISQQARIYKAVSDILANTELSEYPENLFKRIRNYEIEIEKQKITQKQRLLPDQPTDSKEPKGKNIACEVFLMDARPQEKAHGIRRVFLIRPQQDSRVLTGAQIRSYLTKSLGKSFRPASVKTEWIAAERGDGEMRNWGMRVSTADYTLRTYLNQCAEKGEKLMIPHTAQAAAPTRG